MRILKQQAKRRKVVRIPSELVNFLCEVDEKIKSKSEETTVESDDLLQADCAYGGLIDEGSNMFGFTFFPSEDSETTWEIVLSSEEIEAISHNQIKELSLWECTSDNCESLFPGSDYSCFTCDYVEEEPRIPPATYENKIDWGKEFFRLNPNAEGFHIREILQNDSELRAKYGDFSSEEIQEIIREK
jgi:hypothetical protein